MSKSKAKFNLNLLSASSKIETPKLDNDNIKLDAEIKLKANNCDNLNASNAKADVLFLSESVDGNKLENYNFTDLLTDKLFMAKIPDAFNPVLDDPTILNENLKGINFEFDNGKRIKDIFSSVISEKMIDKYTSLFYETDIKGDKYKITERDCFRAFMIYAIKTSEQETDDVDNKNILVVFLLDPYHLVCPVPHNGKSREEVAEKIFDAKKDYSNTFKENFEDKLSNIKFIKKDNL